MSRIAQIRFGYGTGPRVRAQGAEALLAALSGPDPMKKRHPVASLEKVLAGERRLREARKRKQDVQPGQRAMRAMAEAGALAMQARALDAESAFRERLMWFWADHFTVAGGNATRQAMIPAFMDEAIRPHMTGRFSDMLRAVVTHPAMLLYLDQASSVGPDSPGGMRSGRGLNENLARELMELHTLGVGGPYTQADVRALANLLTGLGLSPDAGFVFRPSLAEPGQITVLGRSFGSSQPSLGDIYEALEMLATHPATARFLAGKLARHFIADTPPADLVEDLATVYARNGGALLPVYEALLNHPASMAAPIGKAKTPQQFLLSAMVALGGQPHDVARLTPAEARQLLFQPARAMGQQLFHAPGPNGWPEEAAAWIAPQALATRILWSLRVAEHMAERLPEPARLLDSALGDLAGPDLRFAVHAAETRADAVALILASSEFNRR